MNSDSDTGGTKQTHTLQRQSRHNFFAKLLGCLGPL